MEMPISHTSMIFSSLHVSHSEIITGSERGAGPIASDIANSDVFAVKESDSTEGTNDEYVAISIEDSAKVLVKICICIYMYNSAILNEPS